MQACERTFVEESPIDVALACDQHDMYCRALTSLGLAVRVLNSNVRFPDCAFVEDPAVVLDEIAVLGSMGTASRVAEVLAIETELKRYRDVVRIEPPDSLEGGDVLRIGRTLIVGISTRTNEAGAQALADVTRPFGYNVLPVVVSGSLHLKTAVTALPDNRLLINSEWIDPKQLDQFTLVPIPADEPWAANTLPLAGQIIMPAAHCRTIELLEDLAFKVRPVDISEFGKAEGGVTCLSLIVEDVTRRQSS